MVVGWGEGWEGRQFQEQGGDTQGLNGSLPLLLASSLCFKSSLVQVGVLFFQGFEAIECFVVWVQPQ